MKVASVVKSNMPGNSYRGKKRARRVREERKRRNTSACFECWSGFDVLSESTLRIGPNKEDACIAWAAWAGAGAHAVDASDIVNIVDVH